MLIEAWAGGCPKSVGGEMVFMPGVVPVAGIPKILEGVLFPNNGLEEDVELPNSPPVCAGAVVDVAPKGLGVDWAVAFVVPKSPPEGCCCVLVLGPNRLPPVCWGCVVAVPNNEPPAGCC